MSQKFKVIKSFRTKNSDPEFINKATELNNTLQNKNDKYIIIYTNYEGNRDQEYDMLLAVPVKDGEYFDFDFDLDLMMKTEKLDDNPNNIYSLWQNIYKLEDLKKIRRVYKYDLEMHENGKIQIYFK